METIPSPSTAALLELLRRRNDEEAASDPDVDVQQLAAPEPLTAGVPTLEPGTYRPTTPMIAARFAFAGRWSYAFAGLSWLGISDLERAWTDDEVQDLLAVRRENWETSPLVLFPAARVTLFSTDLEEYNEEYLVWPEGDEGEPRLYHYFGWDEQIFENLDRYLEWLTSESED